LDATAYAISFLGPEDFAIIQTGTLLGEAIISMVSAGTGLGQAFLVSEKTENIPLWILREGIVTSPSGMSWNRSFYFSCKKHIQGAV
jgi:hypothetical protein